MFFKKAKKLVRYLGNFWKKICEQHLSKKQSIKLSAPSN